MNTRRWLHLVFGAALFACAVVSWLQPWTDGYWALAFVGNFAACSHCVGTMPARAPRLQSMLYLLARRVFGKSRRESREYVALVVSTYGPLWARMMDANGRASP